MPSSQTARSARKLTARTKPREHWIIISVMRKNLDLAAVAWTVSILVSAIAVLVWGQGLNWQLSHLSIYQLFPLFGLLAFSLMWSTYVAGALKRHTGLKSPGMKKYYRYVGFAILLAIVIHPTLLIAQLWRDGFGFPPGSYEAYVGSAARWAVIVSSLAWFIFLAYELKRWFGDRSWWPYLSAAGSLALIGIFFHALRLGTNLQHGWYRYLWYFYGFSLILMLIDRYLPKRSAAET
jgi:hypothetical protein